MISAALRVVGTLVSLTRSSGAGLLIEALAEWLDRRNKSRQGNSAQEEFK